MTADEEIGGAGARALFARYRDAEAEAFLDLAGAAEGRLPPEAEASVAAWLAANPALAEDLAAARPVPPSVVPFRPAPRRRAVPEWAAMAAGILGAAWLGYAMGEEASAAFGDPIVQREVAFAPGDVVLPSQGTFFAAFDGR